MGKGKRAGKCNLLRIVTRDDSNIQSRINFAYIEIAVQHGIISGYNDRTFRPNADVTRGQLTKIVVSARGWMLNNPGTPTFSDVARGSTFYEYIETAVAHGILGGYSDGTFRPVNNATRGQISKILYNALTGAH